jgi:hypothetical protein
MRLPAFAVNITAFSACACLAFARNINALFYHFDGSYALVDAHEQLKYGQPVFEYTNNFLQSIGNIQLPVNANLLFFYWPIAWFSDLNVVKIVSYLVIAATVFTSTYAMARMLSLPCRISLIAGWIVGFTACPFVPVWYFYPIFHVGPQFLPILVAPVLAFWLMNRLGRGGLFADAAFTIGLLAWAAYFMSAAMLLLPVIALGTIPYIVMAISLAQSRAELLRKILFIVASLIVAIILRWPWLVAGLFLYTSPNFYPSDFTVVYQDTSYASVFFHIGLGRGYAGLVFIISAALGALVSLRWSNAPLRLAAWTTISLIMLFIFLGWVLVATPHWIFPPPIYFEIAMWPLYGTFSAVALDFVASLLAKRFSQRAGRFVIHPYWMALGGGFVIAVVVVLHKPPTPSGYPFPPQITSAVSFLSDHIGLESKSEFNGRILTAMPVKQDGGDAWSQQMSAAGNWALDSGNDEMSLGLWYYRIPTLFEYNQFLSPEFHAVIKRALQQPPVAHQRNITVLDHPNARILQLLGVRYVLMQQPDASLGALRVTEDRGGEQWGIIELPAPNLATYSPTSVEARSSLSGMLDFINDNEIDLTKRAVSLLPETDQLIPAIKSKLSLEDTDLRLQAESEGRSLIVVPLEFSHCIEIRQMSPDNSSAPTLQRIDGLLTGVVFKRRIDAVLSFRVGPLHNQMCRWADYRELKAMLP